MLMKIIQGNVLDALKTLPDESVDTIVTSPPYWGLRDYGKKANTIWGGDPNCEHEFELKSGFCKKCGAWYGQLGLEPTLEMYIDHMLQITKELKRVLKKTGVMFWNHGDNYSTTPPGNKMSNYQEWSDKGDGLIGRLAKRNAYGSAVIKTNIPQKCKVMQNYRLALRMIDEQGWILRNIIIWHKPNHMPSSVKDRFTNSYEPVFMLVKSKKYWFDLDAVRVPHKESSIKRWELEIKSGRLADPGLNPETKSKLGVGSVVRSGRSNLVQQPHPLGKNPGDVWKIPTQPFPEAHFATYPEKLVEPMIKAGCPKWICKKCGKARVRITKTEYKIRAIRKETEKQQNIDKENGRPNMPTMANAQHYTIGWTNCGCNAGWKPGIVLDPFLGSGTTMAVARRLGCSAIGVEINPKYVEIAKKRVRWGEGLGIKFDIEVI